MRNTVELALPTLSSHPINIAVPGGKSLKTVFFAPNISYYQNLHFRKHKIVGLTSSISYQINVVSISEGNIKMQCSKFITSHNVQLL